MILVIENIFKRERSEKLAQTNAAQSRFVFFLSNRLALRLLEYLGLKADEINHNNDPEVLSCKTAAR